MCRYAVAAKAVTRLVPAVVGVVWIGSGSAPAAQAPAAAPAEQHRAASTARLFAADAGLVLNFVKPEKAADFEGVVARLGEALRASDKPERKQQAAGWKVFRAREPGANGSVLYVFTMDPAVKGADYAVSAILAEAFPAEAQALYRTFAEAYASGQNYVDLTLTAALGP